MKKVLAFAGSNSKNSINKKLVTFAAQQLANTTYEVLDLNDFPLPLYGIDEEKANGIPANAQQFNQLLEQCDGVLLSLAEHNGSYSVAFKNIFDWISRIDMNVWKDKSMLLMSTSPGGRGGQSVLEAAQAKFPRMGAQIIHIFSFPLFSKNFEEGKIIEAKLEAELVAAVLEFEKTL